MNAPAPPLTYVYVGGECVALQVSHNAPDSLNHGRLLLTARGLCGFAGRQRLARVVS